MKENYSLDFIGDIDLEELVKDVEANDDHLENLDDEVKSEDKIESEDKIVFNKFNVPELFSQLFSLLEKQGRDDLAIEVKGLSKKYFKKLSSLNRLNKIKSRINNKEK